MKRVLSTTLLGLCLLSQTLAAVPDSAIYGNLHRLADKLHLKKPKPRKNEYEVRVWQKEQLVRGAAHKVYVVRKTGRTVQLFSYQVYADTWTLRKPVHQQSRHVADSTVWNRLVQSDILTLPDW